MKISIIVPNYNKGKYIAECLTSCLNQTYENLQLIIIDNESTDNSVEIIKEFQNTYPNIFIFDSAINIYPRCWDECVEKAFNYISGEYYTIIASDDYIDKDYIKNSVEFIKTKNCKFFQSSLKWVDNDKNILREMTQNYNNIADLKSLLLKGCYVNSPTVFRKTEIEKKYNISANPLKYSGAGDYDLYCQIVDKNLYIENCSKWIGYYYRINESQATWQMQSDEIKYDKLIQKKWRDKWTN
jgi:glycosyltransferase involved in cell wall biosynthesis